MTQTISYAQEVAELFKQHYPAPKSELNHQNEYQFAVSVMLSAQTTDKKVNQVTVGLFQAIPDWKTLGNSSVPEVEKLIYGVNFHKGKAERLVQAGQLVTEQFGGVLPRDMAGLMKIPGIARKSANVIMHDLWGIADGIVVDTHITRLSNRLGFTKNSDPKKIEQDLMILLPKEYWINYSCAGVLHGRYVCIARKPKCGECFLNQICPSAFKV